MDDTELYFSQWVSLGKLVKQLTTEKSIQRSAALQMLRVRQLPSLRPLLFGHYDEDRVVFTPDDAQANRVVQLLLKPKDELDRCSYPEQVLSQNCYVDWPIPTLLDWLKGTNLSLPIEEYRQWMCDRRPELERRGLLITSASMQTDLKYIENMLKRISSSVIRLKDAPAHLGMNKNRFNSHVRPKLTPIDLGERSVGFSRRELDQWVYQQTDSSTIKSDSEPWELKPNANAKRPVSTNGETSGTSTAKSATPTFDEACKRMTK